MVSSRAARLCECSLDSSRIGSPTSTLLVSWFRERDLGEVWKIGKIEKLGISSPPSETISHFPRLFRHKVLPEDQVW